MLEAGADVNAQANNGFSALMLSCQNGHDMCAREVLKAGADPNKAAGFGWTALMLAANEGHTETCEALLKAGADIDAKDNVSGDVRKGDVDVCRRGEGVVGTVVFASVR